MSDMEQTKEKIEEIENAVEETIEESAKEEAEEPVQEKKKGLKFWHVLVGFFGVIALVYLGFSIYFMNHFYFNTMISGNDCSGKSIQGVVRQLEKQASEYTLTIEERDGKTEVITSEDISLSHELGDVLEKAIDAQNPFLWVISLIEDDEIEVSLEMNYDRDALEAILAGLHCMEESMQVAPVMAQPIFNGSSYEIADEILGTQIDKETYFEKAHEAIATLKTKIQLEEDGCYIAPSYTKDSQEVIEANEIANTYIRAEVTYEAGKNIVVADAEKISSWISFDSRMDVKLDEAAIKKFIKKISKTFNTVGKERTIKTPTGKKATVSGGTYGRVVDQTKELKQLKKNIKAGKIVTREPIYSQKVASGGKYEWGNTYLEVDITEQHMWYIKDGEVVFESDVVTGVPIPARMTPTGVYSILEKMRNKTLRGEIQPNGKPEYITPVSYWMRVTWSGIGFHDATWQRAFGGQRYKQGYGSHGCINMPLGGVSQLYEMVEKGCPVIIHN